MLSRNNTLFRPHRLIHHVVAVSIALIWLWAGLSKIPEYTGVSVHTPEVSQWIDQFPVPLVFSMACLEILLGFAICAGFRKPSLVAGILLLSAFCAALVIWPPLPHQSCGCLGSTATVAGLESADPATRNLFFGSMHLFGLVLLPRPWRPGARHITA